MALQVEPYGAGQAGTDDGARYWRLLEGTKRSLCLLVFVLLFPEPVPGMKEVVQPPFVAGIRGGSVNLTCCLQGDEGKILRTNVYWYFTTNNENELIYLTPEGWHKDRLTLTKSGHITDKSIQVSGLGFNDTRLYICKVSVIDKDTFNSSTVTGNGTQLLVHGPMSIGKVDNDTSLMCQVEAGMVQDIEIVWKEGDTHIPAETMTVVQTDLTAYLLTRRLKVNLSTVNHVNARTFTCLLQHRTEGYITHYTMAVPERFLPMHDFEEPILLYVLLFMNRLLILIMVLVIFKVK
ncbi:nectin-3-like [Lissotriton helveticus]